MVMSNDWLTVNEAAELSGYHPERVRELIRDKKITAQKFGPVWAVYRASMLDYQRKMLDGKGKRGPKPRITSRETAHP